jgi:hypothetical protein
MTHEDKMFNATCVFSKRGRSSICAHPEIKAHLKNVRQIPKNPLTH